MDPIQKIVNANVYEDGSANYLGKIKEAELPKIVHGFTEHDALGQIAKLQLSNGTLEPMMMKLTWASFDSAAWMKSARPGLARKLQVRSTVQAHGAGGLQAQTPITTLLTVQSKQADLGKLANGTASESEEEFNVTYIKQTFGSVVLVEIDVFNLIWNVNGKDQLADFKKNLGIT